MVLARLYRCGDHHFMNDNIKARILDNDLENQYVNPRNKNKVRSQVEIYQYLYQKKYI